MKVIDLLNKIANGEEAPKRIKYRYHIYEYEDGYDFVCDNLEHRYFAENYCNDYEDLNSEVEIIEEDNKIKKLENLNVNYCRDGKLYETLTKDQIALDISTLQNWVNKIIDKINEEK